MRYKDELLTQLQMTAEPEAECEGEDGEVYSLYRLENAAGVIVCKDEDGSLSGEFYEDEEALDEAWADLADEGEDDADDDEE